MPRMDLKATIPNPDEQSFLIGDGSFQLTAREMSMIIHQKLNVVIFLINNAGYTIEQCIHGQDQSRGLFMVGVLA